MPFFTAVSSTHPDYIALAMVLVLFVVVTVMALRKRSALKKAQNPANDIPAPAAPVEVKTAPGSAGELKLHDVDPKTAAMLMAIVADKLGKPLNELRFISIKEVK